MSNLFLLLCLFFPRLTLLSTHLFGTMPANDTPYAIDVLMAIFFPRVLVAYWGQELGIHIGWIFMLVVFAVLEKAGSGRQASRN